MERAASETDIQPASRTRSSAMKRHALGLAIAALSAMVCTSIAFAQYGGGGGGRAAEDAKLAAMPTPKLADGHVDLSGRWGGGGFGGGGATQRFDEKGNYHNLRNDRKGS